MHRRSFTLSLLLWIAIPLITTSAARAESYWVFVEKAAGVVKILYELGSSVVNKASDYGIYTTDYRLERYSDLVETWDHGSPSSVLRSHWRDSVDGSSRYITFNYDRFQTNTTALPFEHSWGSCSWTCSYTTNPAAFVVNGRRFSVVATTYRVFSVLLKAPTSPALLIDPIPLTVVWSAVIHSSTKCGGELDLGGKTFQSSGFLSANRSPLLSYPIVQGLSSDGPRLFLQAKTDQK